MFKQNEEFIAPRLRIKWEAQTDGPVYAPPVIGGQRAGGALVFVLSARLYLYAFNERDGKEVWKSPIGRSTGVNAGCALGANGLLYVGSGNGLLTAVEAASGRQRWQFAARSTGAQMSAPTIDAKGTVYVGSHDRYVYAVDGRTGKIKWEFKTGGYVDYTPALFLSKGESSLIVGSRDGYLYCLDCERGKLRWLYPTHHEIRSVPLVTSESSVIFASGDLTQSRAYLFALDAVSGKRLWKAPVGYPLTIPLALDTGGGIYIGTFDGSVIALDRRTGRERWRSGVGETLSKNDAESPVTSLLVSMRASSVYVVQGNKPLYSLDIKSGKRKETMAYSSETERSTTIPITPLALSSEGLIFYGASSGKVIAASYI